MARLASLIKGGFYATPPRVTDIIATWAQPQPGARILDPFAGEGEALCTLADAWRCTPYAVELHQERYETTAERVEAMGGKALHGPVEFVHTSRGSFEVLYLNPPYDQHTEGDYVTNALKWLAPYGLMLALIPETTAARYGFLSDLTKLVTGVTIRRFPSPEYERFGQVVVAGWRRPKDYGEYDAYNTRYYEIKAITEAIEDGPPVMQPHEFDFPILEPEPGAPGPLFVMQAPDLSTALEQAQAEGVASTPTWETLMAPAVEDLAFRPLEQPKPGHSAMLIAAGVLNGTQIETGGGLMLVKGTSRKYVIEREEDRDDASVEIETEAMEVVLSAFNLDTGDLDVYTSKEPEPYQAFLGEHADALQAEMDRRHVPTFTPDLVDRYLPDLAHYHAPGILPGRTRDDLLPAQQEKAAALAHTLKDSKSVVLVGEMGTGKTTVSMAALYLRYARRYQDEKPVKVVVMCPPHLTRKWKREAETCLRAFNVKAHVVKSVTDVQQAMEEPGPSFLILSSSRAKLGSGWEPAYVKQRRRLVVTRTEVGHDRVRPWQETEVKEVELVDVLCCPDCGEVILEGGELLTEATWGRKPRKCRHCEAPLWQLTRRPPSKSNPRGSASYPLAIFINKHYGGRYSAILDEVQHYKGADSQRALAATHLISGAKKVIAMTGTIYGGKASSLFHLLYRLNIAGFRTQYFYDDVERFIDHYGLRERQVRRKSKPSKRYGRTYAYEQTSTRTREIPGAAPGMVALLLPQTAFVGLADIGVALPPYEEHVHVVEMDPDMAGRYQSGIMSEWRDQALKELRQGEPGEFSAWLQGALGWPDCPEQSEPYTEALDEFDMPAGGWAKDREIVDLVAREVAAGRRVFLYCGQVNRRDPRPRMRDLLAARGIQAVPMNGSVSPEKREKWLEKAVKDGAQVVMANPALVETGMDLLAFPTLVYVGIPTYSIYTIEQSKRRSWRLGQTEPVHVHFFVYGGTVQQVAINLLSDKARAADLVHGDVSRGLASLNAPSNDFLSELTRQVISGQADAEMAAWQPSGSGSNGRVHGRRVPVSPGMREAVAALAAKHRLNLGRVGAYMKLEMDSFLPLVVEVIGPGEVAVGHFYIQNGDVIYDPEITFYTGLEGGWAPTSITQAPVALQKDGELKVLGGYTRIAELRGGELAEVDFRKAADVVDFAEMWARNIEAQGWLEQGELARIERAEPEPAERLPEGELVQLSLL